MKVQQSSIKISVFGPSRVSRVCGVRVSWRRGVRCVCCQAALCLSHAVSLSSVARKPSSCFARNSLPLFSLLARHFPIVARGWIRAQDPLHVCSEGKNRMTRPAPLHWHGERCIVGRSRTSCAACSRGNLKGSCTMMHTRKRERVESILVEKESGWVEKCARIFCHLPAKLPGSEEVKKSKDWRGGRGEATLDGRAARQRERSRRSAYR